MGDLFVPPRLSQADVLLNLADSFAKVIDPSKRSEIAEDIRQYHALNGQEAKKADDARNTIKQNEAILAETKRIATVNSSDRAALIKEREKFYADAEAERAAIALIKSKADEALAKAGDRHDQAAAIENDVKSREIALAAKQAEHVANVAKLEEDRKVAAAERKSLDDYKEQILSLDRTTKEKVEKLRQFNF